MLFKGIEFDEIVDVYDTHGLHDKEVEILGYDKDGVEYAAVGMESCGELVEIYEDTIEKIEMKSPGIVFEPEYLGDR